MQGKRIILGISGGIAAYKAAFLIRLFKKNKADVRVVVTPNALQFITKVTLESLTGNKVYDEVFGEQNDYTTEHISLTDWGEVFVVAPATANIIGKLASGIADDALSTSLLAFNRKVFLAPAMNVKMFNHLAVQNNLQKLAARDVTILEPGEGFLACGYEGKGRMEEPENIFDAVEKFLTPGSLPLAGKSFLVTAGPTHEAIDPVRYIGNHSSGKMGFAIAEKLACLGARVELVSGPTVLQTDHPNIHLTRVVTASEMLKACLTQFDAVHGVIMAAAVADYSPATPASNKIKKEAGISGLNLELIPTPDILKVLGGKKKNQLLVGFALETDHEEANALKKIQEKNLDFIVLNTLKDEGAGFGHSTNKVTLIDNKGEILRFPLKPKKDVAADIVETLRKLL